MLLKKSRSLDFGIPGTVVGLIGGFILSAGFEFPFFMIPVALAGISFFWLRKETLLEDQAIYKKFTFFGKTIRKKKLLGFSTSGAIAVRPKSFSNKGKWAKYHLLYLNKKAPKYGNSIQLVTGQEKAIKMGAEIALFTGLPFKNEVVGPEKPTKSSIPLP